MTTEEFIEQQNACFRSGATRSYAWRKSALTRLKTAILAHEQEINTALSVDLGKSPYESYMCEVGLVLSEINYLQKHLKSFMRRERVRTPLAQFSSRSFILKEPYGTVLIMSPWNYPVLLCLEPLAAALAAGNTAIIKPSEYAPTVSAVLVKLITSVFRSEEVAVIEGGRDVNARLLDLKFDYIFFTGSPIVGRLVMEKAARHLTPVTLELGGKSPCIVDETADLAVAARRIAFGKFLNCGQTCIAPDYLLVAENIKEPLIKELEKAIAEMFGMDPLASSDYGKIINIKHYERLCALMQNGVIRFGGQTQPDRLRIAPTILDQVNLTDPVMQEEIFGPILPILTYRTLDEVIELVGSRPRPLAVYLFTRTRSAERQVLNRLSFGGGCINDTIIHLATTRMPFGGIGESGMGSYHGKYGFDTFTHRKSIVKKALWLDLPIRYQPYNAFKERLLRLFLH